MNDGRALFVVTRVLRPNNGSYVMSIWCFCNVASDEAVYYFDCIDGNSKGQQLSCRPLKHEVFKVHL
jgi:hypothetical protein